ncbi:hypothetical protein WA026_018695 [Henosepilachna vigintioctopunctata]|uniref:Aspartic peptidase DDI1-type domain-containing protein n=1 Tax=Henosepilachna vigintioctopunctata TaxID=420089 RepID=A0AAW1TQF0_9CUCU
MTAPRARFHFISDCLDANTTIVKVLTVQLEKEDKFFQFPTEYQLKEHHRKLFDTSVVRNVTKSMKTRGNFRNVWVTLINELKDNYLDEEGNVCFKGLYLDEAQACVDPYPTSPYIPKSETIGNPRFPQVLKVFLEGPALDWFLAFLKTHTLSYPWEFWQNSFLDTFSEIGWNEINYAYTFRYISGPMLDYALKKRNLLIDADPELTLNSQLNFIVLGLPFQIRSRLRKRDLNSIDILMSHVRQLEGSINNKNKNTSAIEHKRQLQFSNRSVSEPCPYCEEIGFPNRFHSGHLCRNRTNSKQKFKNDKIKMVSNLEVQDSISSSGESEKRITTPLIKLRVLVDNCPVIALYDSAANISVINYNTLEKLNLKKNISGAKKINTVSGFTETLGSIEVTLKIFNISKNWRLFVIKSESFQNDILLGLDVIKEFRLCQNENLKITQKCEQNENNLGNEMNINTVITNVNSNNKNEASLECILDKHKKIFAENKYDVGIVKDYEATIKLTKNKYIARKAYKCSLKDKDEINTQVKSLLKSGIIEHSSSLYASPVTLVFKKDEGKNYVCALIIVS